MAQRPHRERSLYPARRSWPSYAFGLTCDPSLLRTLDIDAKQFGAVTGEGKVVDVEKSLWCDSSKVRFLMTEENASQMVLASYYQPD